MHARTLADRWPWQNIRQCIFFHWLTDGLPANASACIGGPIAWPGITIAHVSPFIGGPCGVPKQQSSVLFCPDAKKGAAYFSCAQRVERLSRKRAFLMSFWVDFG